MSRINTFLQNLRLLVADDFLKRWEAQDKRLDERAAQLNEQLNEISRRLDERFTAFDSRADAYEKAVDTRLDERFAAIDSRLDAYQGALDARIEERLAAGEGMLDERVSASERIIDERFAALERQVHERADRFEETATERATTFEKASTQRADAYETTMANRASTFEQSLSLRADKFEHGIDERLTGFEGAVKKRAEEVEQELIRRADEYEAAATQRANDFESALDARLEARFIAAETRLDLRTSDAEAKLDRDLAASIDRLDKRFDERVTSTDIRLDERFIRIERHIDARFGALEESSDSRMEAHERLVDGKLHQRSQDIVDRNDLMLQIFDQRLDKMRRELHALQPVSASLPPSNIEPLSPEPAQNGSNSGLADTPSDQLTSFRKLAESGVTSLKKVQPGAVSLYEQILSWKKIAHEGILAFTPDEQETVDYILSFLTDPKEIHYTEQHLRRFVSTLERIPPAQSSTDRLLELGSLFHLAPAIKKYCGYQEIHCADFWEGESVVEETLKQKNGSETHTFELRNFNVEVDPFPYPDGFFHVVLCCELIEHLRQDPMHMLWECNRVLHEDGYLLVTTPNIASTRAIEGLLVGCAPYLLAQYNIREIADQHNREYAPYEIGVALAAAGFTVVALETADVWLRSNPAILDLLKQIQITTELRGDNIFALARKTGAPIERYPKELYTE